jgi:GH24 family phage-related lysozyme (muramidase)
MHQFLICMQHYIDDLNLSYSESKDTTEAWLDTVTTLRHELALEALESFGEDLSSKDWNIKVSTEYDTGGMDEQLPEKSDDGFLLGILRFAKSQATVVAGGSPGNWQAAVRDVANWYVHNVTAYSQPTLTLCNLTGKQARWDCSGFVTCCLQRYGILLDTNWPPRSGAYANDDTIGKKLQEGGFHKYLFNGWDSVQPYDIIAYDGHIEIYNGLINGKHTSWAWGAYHPSLPCGTAHVKNGYDVIWRCQGGGIINGIMNIGNTNTVVTPLSPGQTGLSNEIIEFICMQETSHKFGYAMGPKDWNGIDLKDAKGHLTYGYGLLFHPNGQYMDTIKRTWSQPELESLYLQHAKSVSQGIDKWASGKGISLAQRQKDAIASACYNFGMGFLKKDICKMIASNPNDPNIYNTWVHLSDAQGRKYPGLLRRRKQEANWYVSGHA